jgi:thiopurine S-methyltransferase
LQPEFWHDRWQMGQIGFHQSTVDRHLERFWPDLGLEVASRAFVPLCGKSLDVLWLHAQGHAVSGVELSGVALESFCMEHGIASRRRILDDFDIYEAEHLRLFRGDLFALTPELLGCMSAVYDRAALISWKPELRARYVDRMTALTSPGTQTLLVTMEYEQAQMNGPPFSVSADDVERLYSKNHSIRRLSRRDILANEPRLRSRGLTQLHEACYRLIRM